MKKTGRVDGHAVPTLQNGSSVLDFAFDPFNTHRIVVGELRDNMNFVTLARDIQHRETDHITLISLQAEQILFDNV